MKPLPLGIVTALIAFGADQAVKYGMLYGLEIETRAPLRVLPFLDISIAWNRGISYSLLTAENGWGRIGLLAVYAVACCAFMVWLIRAQTRLTGCALGLLIGGATGNALDRLIYGAVADFFHIHFGSFSPWGIFNMADIAIVAGVALLLYESFLIQDKTP